MQFSVTVTDAKAQAIIHNLFVEKEKKTFFFCEEKQESPFTKSTSSHQELVSVFLS